MVNKPLALINWWLNGDINHNLLDLMIMNHSDRNIVMVNKPLALINWWLND